MHIVEFLDPACGTCALFFPMVKQWMTEAPDKLRLSVRLVSIQPTLFDRYHTSYVQFVVLSHQSMLIGGTNARK